MDNRRSAKSTQRFRHISLWVITPAKIGEAYYNINIPTKGDNMTQKYTVPFNIDMEDLIAEDEGMTEEQLSEAIKNEGENHGVEVNTQDMTVTGKIRALADFFMMLDGPGPSFNMEEFVEFVHQNGDLASSKSGVQFIAG